MSVKKYSRVVIRMYDLDNKKVHYTHTVKATRGTSFPTSQAEEILKEYCGKLGYPFTEYEVKQDVRSINPAEKLFVMIPRFGLKEEIEINQMVAEEALANSPAISEEIP